MNEDQLQEMIDLQRFKLNTLEAKHESDMNECCDIFNQIMEELGINDPMPAMFPHNMRVHLKLVQDRNTPGTRGYVVAHGAGRGES